MSAQYKYITDNKEAKEAVEYLSTFSRLGYDTETTGLDVVSGTTKLLLVQLGTEDEAYLFDPRKMDVCILKPIIESPHILKCLHNSKFDYSVVKQTTGIVLHNIFDTMLAYRLLTAGLIEDGKGRFVAAGFRDKTRKNFPYKSLNFLTQRLLGVTLNKEVRASFIGHPYTKEFSRAQLQYAADDVLVLHPLCDILSAQLAEENLIDTALLEFSCVAPVAEMEMNGVRINQDKWRAIIQQTQKKSEEYGKQITAIVDQFSEYNTLFGHSTVNINSQEQLLQTFHKLGFTELQSTDKKVLKEVDHELARLLLDYRGYEKLVSTYGEAILKKINPVTKRLHFTLHQLGADTGRLSSENPNIQNIPNDKDAEDTDSTISFRECFEAEPGNVLLTADFSQVELRILAELSRDRKFLEIFHSGQDLHIITSQQVFGYPDQDLEVYFKLKKKDAPGVDLLQAFSQEEVAVYKKVSKCRSQTKAINFGIAYGMSAFALSKRLRISHSEAEELLNMYFKTYSELKQWLEHSAHQVLSNRCGEQICYAETILGRRKRFFIGDPDDEQAFWKSKSSTQRMGNNHRIQGCSADITKQSLILVNEAYKKYPGAKILFTVHDEIVSECPINIAHEVAAVKAQAMKEGFHRFIKTVPVGKDDEVAVSIAPYWAK